MHTWLEESIHWLQAYVRVHKSMSRKDKWWPDRLKYDFTTFPSWVWDRFNDAAGFNNPELSLYKLAWALMEARHSAVYIGGETRTLNTLFEMITRGLERTIGATSETFSGENTAWVFLTSLCGVLNGYAEDFGLNMRMVITDTQKPWTLEDEGHQELEARTPSRINGTNSVRIQLQNAIDSSKYSWNTLSREQRRTNIFRGRLERSRLLRKVDEGPPKQNLAQLHGQAQELLALQDYQENI